MDPPRGAAPDSVLVKVAIGGPSASAGQHCRVTSAPHRTARRSTPEAHTPAGTTTQPPCPPSTGLTSRGVAGLVQNRKKDPAFAKATRTGAFFGVRSLTRATSRFLGVPRPVAILVGSLFATTASQALKASQRRQAVRTRRRSSDSAAALGPDAAGDAEVCAVLCPSTPVRMLPPRSPRPPFVRPHVHRPWARLGAGASLRPLRPPQASARSSSLVHMRPPPPSFVATPVSPCGAVTP